MAVCWIEFNLETSKLFKHSYVTTGALVYSDYWIRRPGHSTMSAVGNCTKTDSKAPISGSES